MARTPPTIESQIVSARAAGWTVTAIAERTGVSPSTIKRICAKHKIKPGEDAEALISSARKELLSTLTDDERIRTIYSALISDTLAHVALGREKAAEAVAMLTPTDTKSSALTMRALTAHAVMVKAHADSVRALVPKPETAPEELPTLRVETLTEEEIAQMRQDQRRQDAILNGDIIEDECEVDEPDVVELNPE